MRAGLGGDGTGMAAGVGAAAILATRDEKLLEAAWIEDNAVCDIECDRSCGPRNGFPGGANVGVLAVVNAKVVVDVFGKVKETSASSFPSQRCIVGLYTMPFSSMTCQLDSLHSIELPTMCVWLRHLTNKLWLLASAFLSLSGGA